MTMSLAEFAADRGASSAVLGVCPGSVYLTFMLMAIYSAISSMLPSSKLTERLLGISVGESGATPFNCNH
jgi:hypothetical protein